jgi:hypothetical protein
MTQRTLVDESSNTVPKARLGAANSGPRVGPLLVHEIHHSPVGGNADLEFIEIYNPTAATVSLQGWHLRGAVDFNFIAGDAIAAGEVIVVVPFSPTNDAKDGAFRTTYGISATVSLIGPWSTGNHLESADECVLYRADTPPAGEPGYFPLTIEDEVNYASTGGWPDTVSGLSLNRLGTAAWGDTSTSWKGEIPSPGSLNVSYAAWKSFYYPSGVPDDADTDGDGGSTVEEYGFATHPLTWEDQSVNAPVITSETVGGQTSYVFTYTKPLDRTATYTVQNSSDLTNWIAAPDQLVSSTINSETRRAVVPVPAGTTGLFLRLRIDTPK